MNPANERPLHGAAYLMLSLGAAATILLFYAFAVISIVVLVILFAAELVFAIVLARFGLARLFIRTVQRHAALIPIFLRSLRTGKSLEFQIPLASEEAPELYGQLAKICRQAGVPQPQKVYLVPGVNAWVNMKGLRRGAGATFLGIGYDLLAGLTCAEVEAVLGHEMMHAKLVQRGFRQLLSGGIHRAARLTNGLAAQAGAARRAKESAVLTEFFLGCADPLTRLAAHQVASCSRQDEFAADRGAAKLCGAGPIRSSLLKVERLTRIAARLPLRDRIAQLESAGGFSQWLVKELAAAQSGTQPELKAHAFDKYSTHPSLADRVAALSAFPDQSLPDSPPAIGLLTAPDLIAAKLVNAIQKQIIEQERIDSRKLDRLTRKSRSLQRVWPLQATGWLLIIAGVIADPLIIFSTGPSPLLYVLPLVAIAAGVAMAFFGGYREKIALPVPAYPLIRAASLRKADTAQDVFKNLDSELRRTASRTSNRKEKAAIYLSESHAALAQCDYVRAHVAARLCLQQQKNSVPGHLALAVSGGGLNLVQLVGKAIRFVRRRTGLKGASPAWGVGWSLALVGDWMHAEAFLDQARKFKPGAATVLALMAISQSRRGKLFTAIQSARKACSYEPREKDYAKLLIDLLLQGGFLREAGDKLMQFETEAETDPDLTLAMVKLYLTRRDEAGADRWIELVRQNPLGPEKLVTIGQACAAARLDGRAEQLFLEALRTGHYPEALLALGRIEANRQNKEQAERYLLGALDLSRRPADHAAAPLSLLGSILQQLAVLREPLPDCQAWIAGLPRDGQPGPLAGKSFLIYAPTNLEARRAFEGLMQAMQPGNPPMRTNWRQAPKEQQPYGVAYPGIQGMFD